MSYNYVSVELKTLILQGRRVIKGRCPLCGTWTSLDDAQLEGRAEVVCSTPSCTFSERIWLR
jgi:hypothetical protein